MKGPDMLRFISCFASRCSRVMTSIADSCASILTRAGCITLFPNIPWTWISASMEYDRVPSWLRFVWDVGQLVVSELSPWSRPQALIMWLCFPGTSAQNTRRSSFWIIPCRYSRPWRFPYRSWPLAWCIAKQLHQI